MLFETIFYLAVSFLFPENISQAVWQWSLPFLINVEFWLGPIILIITVPFWSFPRGAAEESACNWGDVDSTPQSGRSPGEGNGNLLPYSCWENLIDRGAWWASCVFPISREYITSCVTMKPIFFNINKYNY